MSELEQNIRLGIASAATAAAIFAPLSYKWKSVLVGEFISLAGPG